MASTGASVAVNTTTAKLFDSPRGAGAVSVKNLGAQALLVHCPGLHDGDHLTGDFFSIAQNATHIFRLNQNGIKVIYAKTASASTTVDFGTTEINFNG